MSEHEQNTAIAKFMGWTLVDNDYDFVNDLNLMHEVEKRLCWDDAQEYCRLLSMATGLTKPFSPCSIQGAVCHATAAQRAEALLRCLNLWTP